jgi:hypothetical protein
MRTPLMTSLFDHDRTIEYVGGPWDGHRYTPMVNAAYPRHMHAPWEGELHLYVTKKKRGVIALRYVGKVLPDGSCVQ